MNTRRAVIFALVLAPSLCFPQQADRMSTSLKSIGAGPFEFPISGSFAIEREGGATIFTTKDESRRFIVGYFRNIAGHGSTSKAEQISKLEGVVRGNWERFAKEEKGEVVQVFRRTDSPAGISVFSMATEFVVNGERQYYVQFAATDGPRFASIFAEGFGEARQPLRELEPLILRVTVVDGS